MKRLPIVFGQKATEDILGIVEYLAAENPKAAQAFREDLEHACAVLAEMPGIGMLRSFNHPQLSDVRWWPLKRFEKYLVFYRVHEDALHIIRLVHDARDLPALFSTS